MSLDVHRQWRPPLPIAIKGGKRWKGREGTGRNTVVTRIFTATWSSMGRGADRLRRRGGLSRCQAWAPHFPVRSAPPRCPPMGWFRPEALLINEIGGTG
jgi:hypothetical protein